MATTTIYRTQGTPTNAEKFTFSTWIKRGGSLAAAQRFYQGKQDDNNRLYIKFNADTTIWIYGETASSATMNWTSTKKFRDPSAWYHIVLKGDSTQAAEADRFRVYINGIEETAWTKTATIGQDVDFGNCLASETDGIIISGNEDDNERFYGEMSHVQFVDGSALAPTEFGEFDSTSGIWKIKTSCYATPGANGFCLKMEDRTNLDLDSSSNAHTFTTTGTLTATYDNPDNNFCTGNQLDNYFAGGTFSQGSNTVTTTTAYGYSRCTQGVAAGKWYWENKVKNIAAPDYVIGIASKMSTSATSWLGSAGETYSYDATDGKIYNSASGTAYGDTFTDDDIIGVYLDLDNNKLYFAKNGTVQNSGTGVSITDVFSTESVTTDGVYFPGIGAWSATAGSIYEFNFGNGYFGTDLISSPEADAGGIGAFKYDPSAGTFDGSSKDFRALCTKNIKAYGG